MAKQSPNLSEQIAAISASLAAATNKLNQPTLSLTKLQRTGRCTHGVAASAGTQRPPLAMLAGRITRRHHGRHYELHRFRESRGRAGWYLPGP
jgi:hypothetical protein